MSTHIPVATYRCQFNSQFTFRQAQDIAGYLRDLGISDLYASPLFKAGVQSTHGYDVCDFDQLNPSLGVPADFDHLAARLRELGLGLLLDMVPNHMGNDLSNHWWVDVLEHGLDSDYATWFDIDWHPPHSDLGNRVLLPILEDHYARVLEAGKLQLVFENGGLCVAYYDRKFPLAPASYAAILGELPAIGEAGLSLAAGSAGRAEFAKFKLQLAQRYETSRALREQLAAKLREWNGQPGAPRSFDRLDALLRKQHYRLAYWRVGPEEINYRRFFDITGLVSLRMELPEVFQATHHLLASIIKRGLATGLRIDHPDGLWDPKQYLGRLQECLGGGPGPLSLYVLAEKILTGEESLPPDWPVAGTTGYDFLNCLNGLFVNQAHREAFDALYGSFTGCAFDFKTLVYQSKRRFLESSLRSELNALAHRLKSLAGRTRDGLDFTFSQLRAALASVAAAFPVYRTYISEETAQVAAPDKDYIAQALECARQRDPEVDPAVYAFLAALLRLDPPADLDEAARRQCREFAMKFQQLTGPVMAKGLEDTAFYDFNRLISLNEVGGNPETFGASVEQFHQHNLMKARRWPHALLATATHDTKRGEDTRARINVLSEIPGQWDQTLRRWRELNRAPAPHPNDEYLFYQTLVGAWLPEASQPEGLKRLRERVAAFMLKAIKEAKVRTSWTEPNLAYEETTTRFIEQSLSESNRPFLDNFTAFLRKIAFFGRFNSLSQVLLKLTSPGVPDFYQGSELWDFSLVDPDNRRPVDYATRRRWLAELKECSNRTAPDLPALLDQLLRDAETGRMKLYLIWRVLKFRQAHRELFERGAYLPLPAIGARREHVCAFARVMENQAVVVIAPRLVLGLAADEERAPTGKEIWKDTRLLLPETLPGQDYCNMLTGESISVSGQEERTLGIGEALGLFPVALLKGAAKRH